MTLHSSVGVVYANKVQLSMKTKRPQPNEYEDQQRNSQGKNWQMVFTARDGRILEHIWEYDGFLADRQVRDLEFNPTGLRQAQDRLGKLFHNDYLNRTNRRGKAAHGEMIYWLTKKGAEYVAEVKGIEWTDFRYARVLKRSMEHDILVNDFTIIIHKACEVSADLVLVHWVNESAFRADRDRVAYTTMAGKPASRDVIPDRYYLIERPGDKKFRSRLLLELDNTTHPNTRFADEKVLAGLAYIRSKEYLARFGSNGGRWLVVTTSDQRLGFLKETTERAAKRDARVFYFTTFERVAVDSVLTEPIWYPGGEDAPVALFPARG